MTSRAIEKEVFHQKEIEAAAAADVEAATIAGADQERIVTAEEQQKDGGDEEDEDLEEGELKDDDDDDEDDDDDQSNNRNNDNNFESRRLSGYNNNNNNNTNDDSNNNGSFAKESSAAYGENRHHGVHQHHQNYPSHHSASGQHPPQHMYNIHPHSNRRLSPNSQHQAELHGQYPPNHQHHFSSNSNNNHYRYPTNDGPPPPQQQQMNHHLQDSGGPGMAAMYARGGPGSVGPMHKVNIRCRFYSKTSNKCTWGDHCRFEHRDDSPGPESSFVPDNRLPPGGGPSSSRGPPPPPMGAAERSGPYPPFPGGRHQPYPPPPPPHGYPYEAYGHHHSTPPPLPPHSMPQHSMPPHHWRQQHSPYPSPSSSAHPPESVSPALLPTPAVGAVSATGSSGGSRSAPQPPPGSSSGGSGSSGGGGGGGGSAPPPTGGVPSPGYPSQGSSSAVVYERKHRLAYELAPWNDRGYHPPGKYDRADPAGYPPTGGRGFYRNHYSREPPYGREPLPHMGGPYPSYPSYPSAYRAGPMGPHASHFKYMSSSQRNVPPDTRRSRSNKRGHDEDESSWSDSGSEDSILGQANYSNKKASKHQQSQQPENSASNDPLDQGSGTPPGEPLPEDRERQEMLLNKLKEIEDLMAKKKGEQEDPM